MLLYIDHETATAIADPRLIPVDAVVFFIDNFFPFYRSILFTIIIISSTLIIWSWFKSAVHTDS